MRVGGKFMETIYRLIEFFDLLAMKMIDNWMCEAILFF